MSSIMVTVQEPRPGPTSFLVKVIGKAMAWNGADHVSIEWDAEVNYSDNPSEINSAITNAVIAQMAQQVPPIILESGDVVRICGGAV